jgi:decaprenyl-phosphate phosphoribosyltransferase
VVLCSPGLGVAAAVGLDLVGVLALYVALTAAYTRGSSTSRCSTSRSSPPGFFLRAVAGGVAADLYVSRWFLIVTASGSLFVTIGKRYAEKTGAAAERDTRRGPGAVLGRVPAARC